MNWQRAFFCVALNHLSTRLQLDSVIVDETVDIYSRGDVLIQNCVGFGSAATKNATVGACEDTSSYCLSDSCADATVGIECKCMFKGEEVLFPTDCMQVGYAEQSFEFSDKISKRVAFHPPTVCGDQGPGAFDANADLPHSEA